MGKGKGSSSSSTDEDGTIDKLNVLGVVWGGATDNKDRLNNLIREDDDVGDNGGQRERWEMVEVTIDPEMKKDWYGSAHQ